MLDTDLIPTSNPDYLALISRTVGEMFLERGRRSGDRSAYQQKINGQWQTTTWHQFLDKAVSVTRFLLDQRLNIGDKVCIIGSTRPEWIIADIGGVLAGCVTVGAYPTLAPAQMAYLLDHSDTRIVFAEGKGDIEKLLSIKNDIPNVQCVVVWDTDSLEEQLVTSDWLISWEQATAATASLADIEARQKEVDAHDTALLVYTSGTTGPPKGAMISHHNIMAMLSGAYEFLPNNENDLYMSFLPMAHAVERIMVFYGRISAGSSSAYATSISKVLEEALEVRPTLFGSVPRIFEKAYDKIMAGVEEASPAKQRIFRWAEKQGREVVNLWQAGKPIPLGLKIRYKIADKLIFSKIRAMFGGRVRQFVTGAAPIACEILEFFWAVGCPVFECYGQTEATAMTHGNSPGNVRLGSVGKAVNNIKVKLAEDGEILVRGDLVCKGYYKNEEATAETIDPEGWLHTGDIGKVDEDGFYYIVDRKKHIIITAGGKNLTPANIENEIKPQDSLISQVHVHGDKRPYVTAIVTIAAPEAIEYARKNSLIPDGLDAEAMLAQLVEDPLAIPAHLDQVMAAITAHQPIHDRIREAIARANSNLSRVEMVKRFHILDRDFSVEGDDLTPTLKVKRKNVEEKYSALFDRIYQEAGFAIEV
jgi:long-chain acyl-CoA synthetase